MEIREMREKLIDAFRNRQVKALEGYVKKVNGMVGALVKQEYETIILGKEVKPKKKYNYNKE